MLWTLILEPGNLCPKMCGPLVEILPKKHSHCPGTHWNWQPCILYFNLDYFQTTTLKCNYILFALVFPQLWGAESPSVLPFTRSSLWLQNPNSALQWGSFSLGKPFFSICSAEMLHPFIMPISQSSHFFCRTIPNSCSLDKNSLFSCSDREAQAQSRTEKMPIKILQTQPDSTGKVWSWC